MPTSFEIGNEAEAQVAAIGGRRVPGSGNGKFLKLDAYNKIRFVFSVKASRNIRDTGLRAIEKLWNEAVAGTRGLGGHGDGAKPALAFDLNGEILVVCRLHDYADLVTGETPAFIPPSKAQSRRDRSKRSLLDGQVG